MPLRHFYDGIPGWFSFKGVYEEAVKAAPSDRPSNFVEVGAWKGKSTAFMAVEIINSRKPISFYVVDHWLGSDEEVHRQDPDVRSGKLFDVFKRNLKPVINHIFPLQMSSVEAAQLFEDETVDFLLLDGGHDYESVSADLTAWLPKITKDGIVAGDDYNWAGVKRAITEAFGDKIEVLGEGKGRHWRRA